MFARKTIITARPSILVLLTFHFLIMLPIPEFFENIYLSLLNNQVSTSEIAIATVDQWLAASLSIDLLGLSRHIMVTKSSDLATFQV